MRDVLGMSLFCCFAVALFLFIKLFWSKEKKFYENRLFSVFCLSSAIWSLGFGGLILQTDTEMAYLWRAIGMIGVFAYLITAQMLVFHMAGISKKSKYILSGIAFTGVIVYFLVIQKNQVIYTLDNIGMTYSFRPGFSNNVYITYTIVSALNLMMVCIHMITKAKAKRTRAFGKRFLLAEGIIVIGMLWDTIFPLLGYSALPGSSLAQFLGLLVLYNAVNVVNRSRLNIVNMSEFIYSSLAIPVLVYDDKGKLQVVNDAASSFFELQDESLEEWHISRLFDLDEAQVFNFKEKRRDIDATCCKNHIYCNLAISKIADSYEDIIGYIIIVTDLSERVEIMHGLETAVEEARSANRAKTTFLANMSHEIRTPLHAIIGFSELLLKNNIEADVREYVEDINGASHNLLAIINDILDISKIESGKMELVCDNYYTASLFNDVSLIIANQARRKGLDFIMNISSQMPNMLYGDKVRIRGVLVNLLNNSVKYTKQGHISFSANIKERKDDRIVLQFVVEDTGVGIKEEDKAHLFQSFERIDRKVHYGIEGSGLGLSIVQGYVDLMDGAISVDSKYGKGTIFTVEIVQKIVDERPMDKASAEMSGKYFNPTKERMKIADVKVLVVDDNLVNLKVAANSLGYYGLIVDTVSSGQEAIECCKKNDYQLVFMDQMMPEMDGIEAMKHIREIGADYAEGGSCKIIVLTADAISGARRHLIEEGFDEYLGKPMNFSQLERIFERFLPREKIQLQENKDNAAHQKEDNELIRLKQSLPNVDVVCGIENCGGSITDYYNVLQITYKYGKTQLQELRELYQNEDYDTYVIKIHSMKSTALNIGAATISNMAMEQEKAGKKGDIAFIQSHMEEFQVEYQNLLNEIEAVLASYKKEAAESNSKETLDSRKIHHILICIRRYMEAFEFTKVYDLLDTLKTCEIPREYEKVFEQISAGMESLDVDKVMALLETVEKELL